MTDVIHVDAARLADLVSPEAAIAAVRQAFLGLVRGDFDLPHRLSLGAGAALVMPVHHIPSGETVIKSLSVNFDRAPAISGSTLWMSASSERVLVIDAGALTAIRTGAVVAVATDVLAAKDASGLCIIGAGAQSFHQVQSIAAVRQLQRVVVVDVDPTRSRSLADRLRRTLGPDVEVTTAPTPTQGVGGMGLVCCATTSLTPLFELAALTPDVHVNAIGAYRRDMAELGPDVLSAASVIVVDQLAAAMDEAGDIIRYVEMGAVSPDRFTELGTLLTSTAAPRIGMTIFKSVGLAIQDWAVASLVARRLDLAG